MHLDYYDRRIVPSGPGLHVGDTFVSRRFDGENFIDEPCFFEGHTLEVFKGKESLRVASAGLEANGNCVAPPAVSSVRFAAPTSTSPISANRPPVVKRTSPALVVTRTSTLSVSWNDRALPAPNTSAAN